MTLTLGFVALARTTFDIELALDMTEQVRAGLRDADFALIGPADLVSTLDEAGAAADLLRQMPLDALLVFQATFADSTLLTRLTDALDAPPVLWAVPEAPSGGRLRLNALCGINLGAHALARARLPHTTIYAPPGDAEAMGKLRAVAQAGSVARRLKGARLGRVGEHPDGFDTCIPHAYALRTRFGVEMVQFALGDVFDAVRAADPARVEAVREQVDEQVAGLDEVDQSALRGTLAAYTALQDLARDQRLDGLAVRCWPQFFTELGCAACGALSLLNEAQVPAACETDVNGALTQLVLQWISGEPAFDCDLVSFDRDANTAVLWHCGKAPLSMADPDYVPRATVHSNRKQPLLMEFPLKPGRVTLARISEATGEYRLVIGTGEMIRAPLSFGGTSGVLRWDRPAQDVLDTVLGEGLEHHLALTYGDHEAALLALAKLLDLPVLRL